MITLVKETPNTVLTFGGLMQSLIKSSSDGIVVLSVKGTVLYASPSVKKILGYTAEEVMKIGWFNLMHVEDLESIPAGRERLLANPGIPVKGHIRRMYHKDGSMVWIEATLTNMTHDPEIKGIVNNFRDITEQKIAEKKILNANRLYAFTSDINKTILHTKDEQTLLNEVCRIAVEVGGFKVAWLGQLDQVNKKVPLIAHNNVPDDEVNLFSSATYNDNGPIASLLKNGKFHVINDYSLEPPFSSWSKYAFTRGFQSAITMPIKKSGNILYLISLFSAQKSFFDQQEINLLEDATEEISFALDVFEREKLKLITDEKLKLSELRLKQAQEIAHFGSWELNFSTCIATWSEEACDIYGLSPTDNIQSYGSWLSFIHPDDLDYVKKINKDAEATLSNFAFFHRIVRPDGAIRHLHSHARFEFDEDGRPIGLYGVAHDVTEVKEAENGLRQSQANLRSILDIIPHPIFKKDYHGRFIFVNKSFAQLYGLTPAEMVGRKITELIPGNNDSEYFIRQNQEVIDSGITKIIPEAKFTDSTGQTRIFYATKVPYSVPGINEKLVLGIALDITEQKLAEEEKNKVTTDLVQRNKDLEQFSYIISHNLRAPVANILGLTDMLKIVEHNEEEKRIVMDGLSASAQKLDDVIRDLNYILQIKQPINEHKELVKCSDIIPDIEFSIDHLFRDEDVRIVSDFSAADELLTLKSYFYSIFSNLISNSIKFRRPDVKPLIEIKSRIDGDKIEFTFKDNGIGIDLAKKGDQVFGLYKRFHNHTEGKGIGLYMVKTQVEALGGKITVESDVNIGTTFTIVFENN